MKKHIWACKYTFKIEFSEGFIKKKKVVLDVKFDCQNLYLAKDKEEAHRKFKNNKSWNEVPSWVEVDGNLPSKYTILEKDMVLRIVDSSINILKRDMYSKDFLEYCKQELFDTNVIIN